MMKVTVEKILILFVIGVFIVTSASVLSEAFVPITREQAIGISRKSELVREGLAIAKSHTIESNYYNSSRLKQLAELHTTPIFMDVPRDSFWERRIPEGHTAWEIIWLFDEGIGGHSVIVVIDAERAITVIESMGIGLE
jgi:hypothetical protein